MDISDRFFGDNPNFDDNALTLDYFLHGAIVSNYHRNFATFIQFLPNASEVDHYAKEYTEEQKEKIATANVKFSKNQIYIRGFACRTVRTIVEVPAGEIMGVSYGTAYWHGRTPTFFDKKGKVVQPAYPLLTSFEFQHDDQVDTQFTV